VALGIKARRVPSAAHQGGERLSLFTRRGNDLLSFFPEIAAHLRKLPDCAIDGELVMLDEHGKPESIISEVGAPSRILSA
jgi:hypothetical protein